MTSILAVCAVDRAGGAEIGLLRLLARLRDLGWAVTLTTPGGGPLRAAALGAGHAWAPLAPGGLRRGTGARALAAWPRARRLAREADVVYLNGTVAGRVLPALAARTVLHVHDLVARVAPFWRRADVLLADSRAVAARLGSLARRAHVVGCPIEPDPPRVAPPWEPDGRPVVGFVGRIEPRKGALDLVRAAPQLRAAGARVVVVGDDPFASDPHYTALVRRSDDVEHYSWVEGAAGMLAALDVLVVPSRAEPFGTVAAEALNAGTPVVATNVGGLPEVVADGVTGRLVPPADPDALAGAVIEVLADRARFAAAGPEHARRWHADGYARRVAGLIAPGAAA